MIDENRKIMLILRLWFHLYLLFFKKKQKISGYMQLSPAHQMWGEAFGVVAWLWIFHRARNDLPVVLGYRHPWDHAEDPFDILEAKIHSDDLVDLHAAWESFNSKVST